MFTEFNVQVQSLTIGIESNRFWRVSGIALPQTEEEKLMSEKKKSISNNIDEFSRVGKR